VVNFDVRGLEIIMENQWTPLEAIAMMTRGLLQLMYGLIVSIVFLLILFAYIVSIFEHDEGWHDLDNVEMIFIVLFFVLSKRFFSQRHREQISWWVTACRYCHYSVVYNLLTLSPVLLLLVSENSLAVLDEYTDLYGAVTMLGYLLVLFAFAPALNGRITEDSQPISHSEEVEEEVQHVS
jgi:hypothetical protein